MRAPAPPPPRARAPPGPGRGRAAETRAPPAAPRALARRAAAAAAALLLAASPAPPAAAEDLTIKFPASPDPAVRRAQQAMVQAWAYAAKDFFDPTYNGLGLGGWKEGIQAAIADTSRARGPGEVEAATDALLASLGDPYTRVLRGGDEERFEFQRTGEVLSSGVVVAVGPSGRPEVAFVVPGSPADRAGVRAGDVVEAVGGRAVSAADVPRVPDLLSRPATLRLSRGDGDARRELEAAVAPARTAVSAVQFASLEVPAGGGGAGGAGAGGPRPRVGYVRVVFFGAGTARDMERAISALSAPAGAGGPAALAKRLVSQTLGGAGFGARGAGPDAWVLDLRANPGGIVYNGIEAAQLFLERGDVLCQVRYPDGDVEVVRVPEAGGRVPKGRPVAVLVNGGTASVSEILAASLRDGRAATLVGETTYGKGRTQRIVPLLDGSELLLSNATYLTPGGDRVDGVGLAPDVACRPERTEQVAWRAGEVTAADLALDPCVRAAVERLAGEIRAGAAP